MRWGEPEDLPEVLPEAPEPAVPLPPRASLPPVLTVAEIAAWLGRCERTVTRMINRGELPGFALGGTTYVREHDLIASLDARTKARIARPRDARQSAKSTSNFK